MEKNNKPKGIGTIVDKSKAREWPRELPNAILLPSSFLLKKRKADDYLGNIEIQISSEFSWKKLLIFIAAGVSLLVFFILFFWFLQANA